MLRLFVRQTDLCGRPTTRPRRSNWARNWFSKTTWTGPVSNEPVTITFKQHIGAGDALRTGVYSKTLTFTLSTTMP